MNSPKPLYRVGRETFETDESRLQRALRRYEEGKGLIGGDPSRRPPAKHPSILTQPPAFRLLGSAPEHLESLQSFLKAAPLEIEIGSGRGEFILDWAAQHPQRHFLAFEVKSKLTRRILKKIQKQGLANIWVSDDDARYVLPRLLPPQSVDVFHILFPDPWWKPKHQIRRLFVPPFVEILVILLRPEGILRIATDVPGYAEQIQTMLSAHPQLVTTPAEITQRFRGATPTARQVFCDDIQRPYQFLYYSKKPS
ncbi:MAG: hypothetical protein GXP38_07125 [Chloroflexi bacterium]|nr:hypothetical protein [Chloroflexota bacterium]